MSYTQAYASVSYALLNAFPQSELVRKALGLAGAAAMGADYFLSKRAQRLKQLENEQNIYLKQAELYRREADKLRNGTGSKYLAEEGATPDTDCFSCATAHLAGMEGALRRAAKEAEKEGRCAPPCQKWVHVAAQEPAALFARDWTKEKYEKLPPEQKRLLDKYSPKVEEQMRKIAPTPEGEGVLKAAALLKESIRFAEAGDDIRHPEVEWRRLEAEAELSAAERLRPGTLPPDVAQELRRLRQMVGSGITDAKTLTEAAKKADELSLKINAPAWERMTAEQLKSIAENMHEIRAEFAAERAGGLKRISQINVNDRHHQIDDEIIRAFTRPRTGSAAQMKPEEIPRAFDNIVNRLGERGVPVVIRDLPTEIVRDALGNEIGIRDLEGYYHPGDNSISLNASKAVKDNYAFQGLLHEATHALLHNKPCHPVKSNKPYSEQDEEIEANLTTTATMLELGLPIETRHGKKMTPREIEMDWNKLAGKAGPQTEENVRWATEWLVRAAKGENGSLAAEKCPALRKVG
jgi:hypothetical protein